MYDAENDSKLRSFRNRMLRRLHRPKLPVGLR